MTSLFQSLRNRWADVSLRNSRKNRSPIFSPVDGVELLENRTLLAAPVAPDYSEDFEDGAAETFNPTNPAYWTIEDAGGNMVYQAGGTPFSGLETSLFAPSGKLSGNYVVATDVTAIAQPNQWQDGFIIFDYVSDDDFKYAGMFAGQNQFVIGHWQGDFSNRLAQIDWDDSGKDIVPGQTYNLSFAVTGNTGVLSVDGEELLEAKFEGGSQLQKGEVGVAIYNARTQFDNFEVTKFTDQTDDFDYTPDFSFTNPEYWTVEEDGGIKIHEVADTEFSGTQTAIFDLNGAPLPASYQLSVDLNVLGGPGLWADGFIIFDYQSETDFKYAGAFVGQNQWLIGHYQGGFDNRIAQVDLDDSSQTIDPETTYHLDVIVNGSDVTLLVDSVEIISGSFAGGDDLTDGAVGVAAKNTVAHFSNFAVAEYVPPVVSLLFEEEDLFGLI
ncbi:MAG: hypothetical protein KDA65_02865 [Planctomycetaceae bacterium]|nr:hypothetical protein [Planctomycetaceae bacterium]